MNIDLRERLDASFGEGPLHRSVEDRITAGRRALRIRRAAVAAGSMATIAIVGIGTAVMQDGGADRSDDTTPVVTPSAPAETSLSDAIPVDESWKTSCGSSGQPACDDYLEQTSPVRYLASGILTRVGDDVEILERADNPVAVEGGTSVALEVQHLGSVRWLYLSREQDGTLDGQVADPALSAIGWDEWVAGLATPAVEPGSPPMQPLPLS